MNLNPDELEQVLVDLGVDINSQTLTHFLCYCPFHENKDSPAFAISKLNGLWICFNQMCNLKGNLEQLIEQLGGSDNIKTLLIKAHAMSLLEKATRNIDDEFEKLFGVVDMSETWSAIYDTLRVDYDSSEDVEKLNYLIKRGFEVATLRQFEVGFSEKKNRIVIPVRNESFKLVGVIGRAVEEDRKPKYLYSDNLPKKGILFNLNHAKTYRSVVIVEGSLDALKVHQSGFPNCVAVLGSGFSEQQAELVNRYFLDVIVFGDNDDAGRGLGEQICDRCSTRNIYFAQYPEGRSDPGEMNAGEIRWAIENKRAQIDVLFERFFN